MRLHLLQPYRMGDFGRAKETPMTKIDIYSVIDEAYAPDRILIEPSGVGKLSDVRSAPCAR
jgi:hypothetical protein